MTKSDTLTIRTVDPGEAIGTLKAQRLARLIEAYFRDPETMRRFEEWEKQKEETHAARRV